MSGSSRAVRPDRQCHADRAAAASHTGFKRRATERRKLRPLNDFTASTSVCRSPDCTIGAVKDRQGNVPGIRDGWRW